MAIGADQNNSPSSHVVVLIHGMNTRGYWMNAIEPTLRSAGFEVARTSYGVYSTIRFLLPIRSLRKKAIDRVLRDIEMAVALHNPAKLSAIAHSFGSYVLSEILINKPELTWDRIVFCGSVVREDYPFELVLRRFTPPLLCEIGTKDVLPAIAESITWGYGSIGSTGINRPPAYPRWHNGFRHSDFFQGDFCRRFWVPFLRDGTIRPAVVPSSLSWQVRLVLRLRLRWILVALLLGLMACSTFFALSG